MTEPVLVGLLFADRIIQENNGKKGVIGTFSTFHSAKFPAIFAPWGIYAAVTNLEGEHTFAINLVCETSNQVIINLSGDINSKSSTDVIEITPTILNAVFPRAGKYDLTFIIDGHTIGSRRLTVTNDNPRG